MQFADFPLQASTQAALRAMGYTTPTPIQEDAIPLMLQGEDVIGKAQTGTGKTAAFGVPMIEALGRAPNGVVGLVLVPTRELASQVHEVLVQIAAGTKLRIVKVFGGMGFQGQVDDLRQNAPILLVACPGRLLDLVDRRACDLRSVRVLVLDEADRMLDMGFIHDVRKILALLPKERQSALFSATIDDRVQRLAKDLLRSPATVAVKTETTATELTEQFHVRLEKDQKSHHLFSILQHEVPGKAVVFTRTKHLAKRLAQRLSSTGWSSVALQGNMTQGQRERAMETFRGGQARILVATDVAARGLDVPDITHVFNFDLPQEPEQYVHRVGRTGRNGATGRSITFVQSDEVGSFRIIKQLAGTEIPHMEVDLIEFPKGPDTIPSAPKAAGARPPAGANPSRGPSRPRTKSAPSTSSAPRSSGSGGQGGQGRSGGRSNGGRSSGGRSNGHSSGGRSGGRSTGARRY